MPENLADTCAGCGQQFSVEHAFSCRKGGQILARHDDLKEEFGTLAAHAFGRSRVFDEPVIKTSRDVRAAGQPGGEVMPDIRGNIGVHNFWT